MSLTREPSTLRRRVSDTGSRVIQQTGLHSYVPRTYDKNATDEHPGSCTTYENAAGESLDIIQNRLKVCLRKNVSRNLLLQKLSRKQYLPYIFEKKAKMYLIEGRF